MFFLSVQTSWCRKTQTRYLHDNMLVWYTSDSGDTEDKDWRTQSISAPILSSEAGNWGEKTRRRVGSVQFAPKLCLALLVFNNFDINVHGFHNIWRKILSFLALWHLWIYQQDTMLNQAKHWVNLKCGCLLAKLIFDDFKHLCSPKCLLQDSLMSDFC